MKIDYIINWSVIVGLGVLTFGLMLPYTYRMIKEDKKTRRALGLK